VFADGGLDGHSVSAVVHNPNAPFDYTISPFPGLSSFYLSVPVYVGRNFYLGYNLAGSSAFDVLLVNQAGVNQLKAGLRPTAWVQSLSRVRQTNPFQRTDIGQALETLYLVVVGYSVTFRVVGDVTFYALATGQNTANSTLDLAFVSGPVLHGQGNVTIPIGAGDRWVSTPLPAGSTISIGYVLNANNRFNVLLLDKENLARVVGEELFTYYVFYSRTDMIGAHLEAETVRKIPSDLYIVINCVDAFQDVTVTGTIIFEKQPSKQV